MSQYKPYPAYKDSGVEWLGQVPEHWEKIPLKWLFDCLDGKRVPLNSEQRSDIKGEIPYWGSGGIVDYICKYIFDESLILLGEDGAPFFDKNRPVAYEISGKSWINNHIHVLRLMRDLPQAWFVHYLNSVEYRLYIDGSTRDKLTQEDMKDIVLLIPPKEEIYSAISHLNRETTHIDALITKKTRFIELLREKRQSLITHAVTKGLDPNVKMKDSGVEWLGEVPEHWEIRPLKAILEKMFNGTSAEQVSPEEGAVKVTRIETISRGEINLDKVGYILQTDALSKYKLLAGDIQFSNINSLSMLGNSALFKGESELYAGMNLLVLRPRVDVVPKWLHQVITSSGFRKQVEISGKPAINQASISQGTLGSLFFPVPCREEQFSIAAYLDRETNRMDTLITKTTRSIELLKERRSALITAAVTGQIDLREHIHA